MVTRPTDWEVSLIFCWVGTNRTLSAIQTKPFITFRLVAVGFWSPILTSSARQALKDSSRRQRTFRVLAIQQLIALGLADSAKEPLPRLTT